MTTKSNTAALASIRAAAKASKGIVAASVIAKAFKLNPKVARARLRKAIASKAVSVREEGRFYAVPVADAAKLAKVMGA